MNKVCSCFSHAASRGLEDEKGLQVEKLQAAGQGPVHQFGGAPDDAHVLPCVFATKTCEITPRKLTYYSRKRCTDERISHLGVDRLAQDLLEGVLPYHPAKRAL